MMRLPDLFKPALLGDDQAKSWKYVQKAVQKMCDILRFRHTMHEALQA